MVDNIGSNLFNTSLTIKELTLFLLWMSV